MDHIFLIFVILIMSGSFGGYISFLSTKANKEPLFLSMEVFKSIFVGVAASLLVPLFLNTISSNLIAESENDKYKLLIIIGFCLLASISSKSFIQIMTNKVMKDLNEVKSNLNEVKEEMNVIVSNETESEDELSDQTIVSIENQNDERFIILKALSESAYIYRSVAGIHKQVGLSKETIHKVINILILEGYVEQTTRAKGIRFYITSKGRQVLFKL
ncbi:YEATS-associated helix-containing protein [Paenibacillus sp. YIM B09110]|uniref:YEATS-associated helix-containing protein n=1 Tax=Paenibacillus sp. YIM B09110 TaxID=3126102 RepID=UPI00301C4032